MADTIRKNHSQLGIGEKIRAIRQNKGLSIQELAEKAGLAKALISQIENAQVSPPIATLLKVANSLNTDMSLLFQEEASDAKTAVVRSNERLLSPRRQVRGKARLGYTYEALAYTKTSKHMEPFLVTFEAKDADDVIQFTHEGEECAFVLEGTLEFSSPEETVVLEPGDCIYFESDQLHGFRALHGQSAKALVTVYHR